MAEYRLGEVERQFAEIIWEKEPLSSGELVTLCAKELDWKKSTTYTVLKRVCERGLFQNMDGTVTSLVSRDEFFGKQSEQFVEETFDGSLPSFVAAFTSQKKFSEEEIRELEELIKAAKGRDR
jgi:predicted transcriptional regulator